MKFALQVTETETDWKGFIELVCPGATDVQITNDSDDQHDLVKRVTWVYKGRSYDAMVGRVKLLAKGGRG